MTDPLVLPAGDALTIGIDIGGTKVAAGLVDAAGTVLSQCEEPTPSSSPEAVLDVVTAVVARLRAAATAGDLEVIAVGVGAAGFVDVARATVLFAPNLAWRQEPLRDGIAARVGLPVVVENDANAMAWGEYRFGAGRGAADLVCVTVGTGIGGGIVLNGQLHRGTFGVAGEVGHLRVVPDGRLCGCGNHGCWEQYCSGRVLAREARDRLRAAPESAGALLQLAGGNPEAVTGRIVTAAAQAGDPVALECFDTVGRWLGQGLADLAAILDPERFVVGGGVIQAGSLLLDPASRAYADALTGSRYRPRAGIVPARLGPVAGMVGAADLARLA
ncbi:MAG TPA: ROK family glucokinase [Mycobacteriales bacterium]|nr:ROK family glucokinase [Mycobacteriales bacterium]